MRDTQDAPISDFRIDFYGGDGASHQCNPLSGVRLMWLAASALLHSVRSAHDGFAQAGLIFGLSLRYDFRPTHR